MTSAVNLAVRVVRAPRGLPVPEDFEVVELPVPRPGPGQVHLRGRWLAIDPSARRRLPSAGPGPLGAVTGLGEVVLAGVVPATCGLDGAVIGEVVESRHPGFAPGDLVRGGTSWQVHHVVDGDLLDRLEPEPGIDPTWELGLLGRPGLVAHCALRVGAVRPGETVVVSAAGGAVGMAVGQLARLAGARVVGIASGDKVRHVVEELGFDACVDRRVADLGAELDRVCPEGVDVYVDNVGGAVSATVFSRLREHGRLVVCGMAGEYNDTEPAAGPALRPVLRKRLRIEGFVVSDHYDDYPAYRAAALDAIRAGRLTYRTDVVDGIEQAPAALAGLLEGRFAGRVLVRLDPPTPDPPTDLTTDTSRSS